MVETLILRKNKVNLVHLMNIKSKIYIYLQNIALKSTKIPRKAETEGTFSILRLIGTDQSTFCSFGKSWIFETIQNLVRYEFPSTLCYLLSKVEKNRYQKF
jgi:hypothetical protein